MIRAQIVCMSLLFASAAVAADKPAGEMGTDITCGQMIASKAPMPAKMGEMMEHFGMYAQGHAKTVDKKDKTGKAEIALMTRMAKDHLALAKSLKAMAAAMEKGKDIPHPAHDEKAMMDPALMEHMKMGVAAQKELANMMLEDARKMDEMFKGGAKAK